MGWLLLLLFNFNFAFANTNEGVLAEVDQFLGQPSFADSYHAGDQTVLKFEESGFGGNSSTRSEAIVEMIPPKARIVVRGSSGRVIEVSEMTQERWGQFKGSMIRANFESLQSFGFKLNLAVSGERLMPVLINGQNRNLKGRVISYSGQNGIGQKLNGLWIVVRELPARAQLIYREEQQSRILRKWSIESFAGETPHLSLSALSPTVRLATTLQTYPYRYGANQNCQDPRGLCGFEVELFDAICQAQSLTCQWLIVDDNLLIQGLLQPNKFGVFRYDGILASLEASEDLRKQMLFSAAYMQLDRVFAGRKGLKVHFDDQGFPVDNAGLRIGVKGEVFLKDLRTHYRDELKHLRLVEILDGSQSLLSGLVDLVYIAAGTEAEIISHPQFQIYGNLLHPQTQDPLGGIGAATRISSSGRELQQAFSQGLVKIRLSGEYQKISQKWFGRDLWDCRLGPRIKDSPCPQF